MQDNLAPWSVRESRTIVKDKWIDLVQCLNVLGR